MVKRDLMVKVLPNRIQSNEDLKESQERILRKFPLLGSTLSKLKFVLADNVSTAGTDGNTVYYSPKFFDTLTESQKDFVIAHEVLHVAFNHIMRSKDKNQKLWNIATDAVINQILKNEKLSMPEIGIDIADAVNRSAEEVYEKLLKKQDEKRKQHENEQQKENKSENAGQKQQGDQKQQENQERQNGQEPQADEQQQENQEQQNAQGEPGNQEQQNVQEQSGDMFNDLDIDWDDENEQVGHDNHDLWKEAVERAAQENSKQQESQEQQNGQEEQGTPQQKDTSEQAKASKQNEEPAASHDSNSEKTFTDANQAARAEMARQIRARLKQQRNEYFASLREKSYGDIGESESVMDWKKVLKKMLEDEDDRWSYRRSNAENDFMARVETLEDEQRAETEVLLDTSGSVDEDMLREFLRQLKPLLKTSKLSVGCFDHCFYGFTEIKTKADIDRYSVRGGGCTDLDRAVKSFSKDKKINKIVFTDGGIGGCRMPSKETKNINVIWLVYDNPNYNPVCGKVIPVSRNTFKPVQKQVSRRLFRSNER